MKRQLTDKELSNLKLPKKVGDKFNMTRFHEGLPGWEGTFTVSGFRISMWKTFSPKFSKLSRCFKYKSSNATLQENLKKDLMDSDYKHHEIIVYNKETGGNTALRHCIRE